MWQIVPPIGLVQKILGEQKTKNTASYRLNSHCMCVKQPEGVLLYHTLTRELLLLFHGEAEQLARLPGPVPPALAGLVPRWFLMPEDADDMALADQVRDIVRRLRREDGALTEYTIFTTTACNARCFYCFEAGIKKAAMTEQTALNTAAYIAAHRGGKPVRVAWFGGEPLLNIRVIDIITDCLRQRDVEFRSSMSTNGYLFDEALARRVKDDWKMEMVQITLDGTEEVYNARKAYVHPEGSPYQRVLKNIGLLLDEGVRVQVRLNMDGDNEGDLYALVDELAERFAGKPNFGVYSMMLWENTGFNPHQYTEEECYSYAEKLRSLRSYTEKKGIAVRGLLKRGFVADACSADDDSFITVTPEGRLGRCAACKSGDIWGSVYSDERDEEVLRQWKERKPPEAVCRTCVIYPQCIRLKKCPSWGESCSPIKRASREDRRRQAVLDAYEDWKAAGRP